MDTFVTVEAVFFRHAVALGLPARDGEESLGDYAARVAASAISKAKGTEAARCLGEAIDAARVAAHDETLHWLSQARKHIPAE